MTDTAAKVELFLHSPTNWRAEKNHGVLSEEHIQHYYSDLRERCMKTVWNGSILWRLVCIMKWTADIT